MKNLLLLALLAILFATACGDDDVATPEQDCFYCVDGEDTLIYCYFTNGDTHTYTIMDSEDTITLPLQGETWYEFKERLDCTDLEIPTDPTCFDCTVDTITTTYCYYADSTNYTISVGGVMDTLQLPSGVTMENFMAGIQQNCE